MKNCQFCGAEFRLNVVVSRHTKKKFLRAGCCDAPLRECPDIDLLLASHDLSQEERSYLKRLKPLSWFSGQVASVLLQIESKVEAAREVA